MSETEKLHRETMRLLRMARREYLRRMEGFAAREMRQETREEIREALSEVSNGRA